MPTLNGVFENQPIVSDSQVAENNLLADEKGPWKRGAGSYLYTHSFLIDFYKKDAKMLQKSL